MKYIITLVLVFLFLACEKDKTTGPDVSDASSSSSTEGSSSSEAEGGSSIENSSSSMEDDSSSSVTDSISSMEDNSSSSIADTISSMNDNSSSSVADTISSMDDNSSSSVADTISSMNDNSSSSVADTISSAEDSSSSSLDESSSSEDVSSSSGFVHVLDTGSFTDARDNQVYKYTVIGSQTWMAQNLNYETDEKSYCYNDDEAMCDLYGRLYEWDEAMQNHPADDTLKIQGVCPAGWHLPSESAWWDLARYVDTNTVNGGHGGWDFYSIGPLLKSTSGWLDNDDGPGNGTDLFGFNALPSGRRSSQGHSNYLTGYAYFMSTSGHNNATPNGHSLYASFQLSFEDALLDHNWEMSSEDGLSVRCIKDE